MQTAVVIPFFQRSPGILRETLLALAAQTADIRPQVIIVDDGSPIDAASEIPAELARRADILVIRQPNQGAAVARNRAIQAVGERVEAIALLDSDDTWSPEHLARSLAQLRDGADLYVADCRLINGVHTMLDVEAFRRSGLVIPIGEDCFEYPGRSDFAPFHHLLIKGFFQTSSVVYRRRAFGHLRFDPAFRIGQDYLFFLSMLALRPRLVLSPATEVTCRRGVNVWAGRLAERRQLVASVLRVGRQLDWIEAHLGLDATAREIIGARRAIVARDLVHGLAGNGLTGDQIWPLALQILRHPRLGVEALRTAMRRTSGPSTLRDLLLRFAA
jgi:succinoglycan biosynthesis protein ExoW